MRLLAIDPGPVESAWVLYDTDSRQVIVWGKEANDLVEVIVEGDAHRMAIEMIASYGMPVGAEVFETCVQIGRFLSTWEDSGMPRRFAHRVTRIQCKSHLCHSARATDANIRQALIDRFGPGKDAAIGRKATPGSLYGLSGDGWAALAVAVTVADTVLDTERVAA